MENNTKIQEDKFPWKLVKKGFKQGTKGRLK